MKEMNGNAQIIEGVLGDEAAIGYVGVGYVVDKATGKPMKGLKVLNIAKDAKSAGVLAHWKSGPSTTGKYPISRPLYQSTNGKPRADVAAFIAFESGPKARRSSSGKDSIRSAPSTRARTPRTSSNPQPWGREKPGRSSRPALPSPSQRGA